ncbi:COX15/CtaA family protein [Candidatus Poriferisocius sp.]|uniref:COX15/CtaA family protein n=1 Tax=Candidatus Poriferisocius sp. TaxID=3101276 RepID=UPI003B012DE6
MIRPRVHPAAYRRIAIGALALLTLIIVSGGAVRLTGSGLGCPDWPACDNDQLVAPLEVHAMIEFINRLITGLVSAIVIATVLGSHWRVPRRSDLVWLSWGLVAGVLAQIVLGGLVVLYELPPVLVIGHFLLSMVLLWNAAVLYWRACAENPPPNPPRSRRQWLSNRQWLGNRRWLSNRRWLGNRRWLSNGVVAVTSVVIVTGTIVTGAGPHGGDEDAERIDVAVRDVARVHGTSVVVLLVVLAALVWWLHKRQAPERTQFWGRAVLGVALAQGLIGYVQYFTGVPVLLVGAHIAGAALLWIATVFFWLTMRATTDASTDAATDGGYATRVVPA